MSINTCHANEGVVLFNGEWLLIYYDGCELHVDGKGSRSSVLRGNKKGRVYLTSHRVLFHNRDSKDQFQSLSMPFVSMRQVDIEQPVFGANYIKGQVIAEPNGGLDGAATFKLWFNNGGAIEFGRAMLTAASQASRNASSFRAPVVTVVQYCTTDYYPAAPPAYTPPPPAYSTYYSTWVPTNTFNAQPPPGSIYMYSAPPPYPGVNGTMPPPSAPPQPQPQAIYGSPAYDKATEAGYYEPPPVYQPR